MKKMMLATLALVMLFCVVSTPSFAATSVYDFTFRDTSGNAYCDGLLVYLYKAGGSKTLVDGYHWNNNCSGGQSNVNGFKGAIAPQYQYAGLGANLIISDPMANPTGFVWLVNPVYSTWTLWESGAGSGEVVVNYGTFVNGTMADKKGTKAASKR